MQLQAVPFALLLTAAAAGQTTEVSVMPGYPNAPHLSPEERHVAREGAPVILWGNANRGVDIDPLATYEWYLAPNGNVSVTTDGDLTGNVTDALLIPEEVTFELLNESTREVVVATLMVDDGANGASQSTVELLVVADDDPMTDDEVEALRLDGRIAVQDGLRYLYLTQLRTTTTLDGSWPEGPYRGGIASFCLWSIQNQGHSILNDPVEDIMAPVVERGLNYIFREEAMVQTELDERVTPRATEALGAAVEGVSDLNSNGQIVQFSANSRTGYETPIITAALVASLAPDYVITQGPGAGMTIRTMVEDAIDWMGAGQNADDDSNWEGTSFNFRGRGGWDYNPSYTRTRSDMSVNSWFYIAMEGAIDVMGIEVPDWIKKGVEYSLLGHMEGEIGETPFGYVSTTPLTSTSGMATTAGGLTGIILAESGTTPGDVIAQYTDYGLNTLTEQRQNALRWIGANWDQPGGNTLGVGNRRNYYSMWTAARALRATARALGLPEGENVQLIHDGELFDWETGAAPGSTVVPLGAREGYWSWLVNNQDRTSSVNDRGRWNTGHQLGRPGSTAMAVMILTRNVFLDPCPDLVTIPVDSVDPFEGSTMTAGMPFTFSGRAIRAGISRPIVSVEVNGVPVESLDASGQFFTSLVLAAGSNTVQIEAFDACGSEISTVELFGSTYGEDLDDYSDATPYLEIEYRNTTYNQENGWLVVDASVCNQFDAPLPGPFLLVIDSFDTTAVGAVNADGVLPDGRQYFSFQASAGAPVLQPGECSAARTLIFSNPGLEPFNFQTTWLSPGNGPPAFQSSPRVRTGVDVAYRYAPTAIDPEGQTVGYALLAAPFGMALDGGTGEVVWTPTLADVGLHQVILEATDGTFGSARQTWTLEVAEEVGSEPPFFTSSPVTSVPVGASYSYQVTSADPTGDARTVSLIAGPGGMVASPEGLVTWGFTLPGVYPVQLRVTDSTGAYADQGFTLAVGSTSTNPNSPTLDGNPTLVAAAGIPYIYQPIASDPDASDVLSFQLDVAPTGMTVNPVTGRVDWLPGVAQIGEAAAVLRVEDGAGGFGTQSWTIDVRSDYGNGAPVITSTPNRLALVGQAYAYDVEAFDAELDPVRFELVAPPAGMTIDPGSGVIDWTPTAGGPVTVAIKAFDGPGSEGIFGSQVYELDVAPMNTAPMIVSTPATTGPLGLTYYYDANAIDAEAQPLSYALLAGPATATIDAQTGIVRWAAGEGEPTLAAFEVLVSDIFGAGATQAWNVELLPDTEAPEVIVVANPQVASMGEPIELCVVAADDLGVVERTLTIDGSAAALSPTGCTTEVFPNPGTIQLLATARDAAGNVGVESISLVVVDPNDMDVPMIEIVSPAPGELIVGPVEIVANIEDNTPASLTWRVESRRSGTAEWSEIASGAGAVSGSPIARFDTTMLANGEYDVRVVAEDGVNAPFALQFPYAVAGDFKLGDYEAGFTDLAVPLAGFPMAVQRMYSTLDTSAGDFGPGWRLGLAGGITDSAPEVGGNFEIAYGGATRAYVNLPTGELAIFRFQPIGIPFFFGSMAGFEAEGATTGTLEPALAEDGFVFLSGGKFYTPFAGYNPSLFKYTDREGNEFLIDEVEGLQLITDTDGETIAVERDQIVSSRGPVVTFTRDAMGRIESVTGPDDDPGDGNPPLSVSYVYEPGTGQLIGVVDAMGGMTEYLYGNPAFPDYITEIRDAAGMSVVRNKFDDEGRLIAQCGPNGNIETCEGCVAFEIDSAAEFQSVISAAGDRLDLFYSERGELLVERRWFEGTDFFEIQRTYDEMGRLASETLPNGGTTSMAYNGDGELISVTNAEGKTWSRTYGDCGIESIIEPDGDTTVVLYDEDCRPIGLRDPLGNIEQVAYGEDGRIKSATNAEGGTVCLEYADGGRLSGFMDQEGSLEQMVLNSEKTLDRRITRRGDQIDFTYDDLGRLVQEDWDDGTSITYAYDVGGRLMRVADQVSTVEFSYWPAGMIREIKTTFLSDGAVERVVYGSGDIDAPTMGYDLRGNLTSILDSHGGQTVFEFDRLGRLASLGWPSAAGAALGGTPTGGAMTGSSSQQAGALAQAGASVPLGGSPIAGAGGSVSIPPAATVRNVWRDGTLGDSWVLRRIERIPGAPTGSSAVTTSFSYGAEGDPNTLTGIEHVLEATGAPIGALTYTRATDGFFDSWTDAEGTHTLLLDGLQRVLEVDHPAGVQPDETYAYDANGNRVLSSVDSGYQHSVDVGEGSDRLTATDSYLFEYDAVGSMTRMEDLATGDVLVLTYDARRRCKSVVRTNGGVETRRAEFEYDPLDRLIEERVDGAVTRFVYDGVNPFLLVDGDGNVIERRLYGREYDEVYAASRGDQVFWPLLDSIGTVREWASADGQTVEHFVYDLFGNRLAGDPSGLPNLGFHSRPQVADLPLMDFRERLYSPVLGRFTEEDPLRPFGYAFALNNPLDYSDPSGKSALLEAACLDGFGVAAGITIGNIAGGVFDAAVRGAALGISGGDAGGAAALGRKAVENFVLGVTIDLAILVLPINLPCAVNALDTVGDATVILGSGGGFKSRFLGDPLKNLVRPSLGLGGGPISSF